MKRLSCQEQLLTPTLTQAHVVSTIARLVLGFLLAALLALASTILLKTLYNKISQSLYVENSKNIGGRGELGPSNPLLNRSVVPEAKEQISLRELLAEHTLKREVFRLRLISSNCPLGRQAYLYVKTYVYDYIEKKKTDYVLEMYSRAYRYYVNVKRLSLRDKTGTATCYVEYLVNLTSLENTHVLPGVKVALPHLTYLYSMTVVKTTEHVPLVFRFYRESDVLIAVGSIPVVYEARSYVLKPDMVKDLLREIYLSDEQTLSMAVPSVYLEVPSSLKPYLRGIVKKIKLECSYGNLNCVVEEIWNWIRSRYVYSRNVEVPSNEDPLIYVLTKGKHVNCLLANLIALLILRMLNIPARLVIGYIAPLAGETAIVASDYGHAWIELLVPSVGNVGDIKTCYNNVCGLWVPLDFTPPPAGESARTYPNTASISRAASSHRGQGGGSGKSSGTSSSGRSGSSRSSSSSTSSSMRQSGSGLPMQYVYVVRGYCNTSKIHIPTGKWRVGRVINGLYSHAEVIEQGLGWITLHVCVPPDAPPLNDTVRVLVYSIRERRVVEVPVLVIIRAKTRVRVSRIEPSIYLAPGSAFTVTGRVTTDRGEPVMTGRVQVYISRSKYDKPIVKCEGSVHNGYFNVTCRLPYTTALGKYVLYAVYDGTSNYLSSKSDPVIYITHGLLITPECTTCIAVHRKVLIKIDIAIAPFATSRIASPEARASILLDLLKSGRAELVHSDSCSVRITDSSFEITFSKISHCSVKFVYYGSPEYAYTETRLDVYPVRVRICINDRCIDSWSASAVPQISLTRGVYTLRYGISLGKDLRQRISAPYFLCLYGKRTYCIYLRKLSGNVKLNLSEVPPGKYSVKLKLADIRTIDSLFTLVLYRVATFKDVHYRLNGSRLIVRGLIVDKLTDRPLSGLVCVRELKLCSPVVNGEFNMNLNVRQGLSMLTLIFKPSEPYTLSRPYIIRLGEGIPLLFIIVPAIAVSALISSVIVYRLRASRRETCMKKSLALRYLSDRYYVSLVLPDIEPDMPPLWSTDRPLRVLVKITSRDGKVVPCTQTRIEINGVYSGTGCEHAVKFSKHGDYTLRIYVENELVAEQSIRIVDYRSECEKLYNITVLEYAKKVGLNPDSLTPRQILEKLSSRLPSSDLETITSIFEIARYSQHDVERRHFVEMVRALRKLGFKVY